MIQTVDGLGRPLYVIDGKKRLHPFTYEEMPDDWQMDWPGNGNVSIYGALLPGLILFALGLIGALIKTALR